MSNIIVRITGAEHDEMLAAHKAGVIVERGGMRFKTIEYSAFQHDDGPIGFFTLVEVEDGEKPVESSDIVEETETTKPGFMKRVLGI